MTAASKDPLIGHVLEGRYVIESRIARGGMAVVYQGVDKRLHRTVAIKVMHPHLVDNPDFRKRFEQEARSAAKLTHPNLVSVLDQGEEHPIVYLVMEYLPGITLRELLKEQGFLTTQQTLEISEAVLKGLSAAHQAGIIHRDLKPENVLLADDGRVKLADFGLARAASNNTTTGQALLGTVAYLSPELITRGTADKRSDIYAFGIMLYEMLTGKQPFVGEQAMQVAYQHAHDPLPVPSAVSKEATPLLDELAHWATLKNPEERPRDASELLRALQRGHKPITNAQQTTVLPSEAVTTMFPETGATTAFNDTESRGLTDEQATAAIPAGIKQARTLARKRRFKGFLATVSAIILIFGSLGLSWWKFLGPGADVVLPGLINETTEVAVATLKDLQLVPGVTQCSSLEVAAGLIASMDPPANTRVKKDTRVNLCESTGPEELTPPDIVGMQLLDAEEAIAEARFTFGGVLRKVFDDAPQDEVLAAVTENGDALPELYPENSSIWVIISAGYLPNPQGLSLDAARTMIEDAGLILDEGAFSYDYSSEVEKDHVLNLVTFSDRLTTGDRVSLRISMGPELFEVPDVSGMTIREAMNVLSEHGFEPRPPWYLNDPAYDSFTVRNTSPKAGSKHELGTEVDINAKII